MIKNHLLIGFMLFIVACGGETNEADSNPSDRNSEVVAENEAPTEREDAAEPLNPLEDPCQVSGADLAEMLGDDSFSDGRPNGINNEWMKACDYGSNRGNFQIAFQRYKNQVIEKKYLEKTYQNILAEAPNDLKVQEVTDGFGDQSVFMHGPEGPIYSYTLKWRLGNHTEKSLRFSSSSEQDSQEKLEQLKAIAAKIQN